VNCEQHVIIPHVRNVLKVTMSSAMYILDLGYSSLIPYDFLGLY